MAASYSTQPPDTSRRVPTDGDGHALPSAVPSFLEACAKLAAEAALKGDIERAKMLIEKAALVATKAAEAVAR